MNTPQRNMLETFLQYGDLLNANLVFVGKEEGVWNLPDPHAPRISGLARDRLLNDPFYVPFRIYINGVNHKDGWYIDEQHWNFITNPDGALAHAIHAAIAAQQLNLPWQPPAVNVINMQTRLHWLLQPGNRTHNYTPHRLTNYAGYNHRYRRHMIDFYPYPKRGESAWDPFYNCHPIHNITNYYNHYNTPNNNRWNIIKALYDKYDMDVTVSYIGKRNGNFSKQNFYQNVGFGDFVLLNTGLINPTYTGPIVGSPRPKDFLIGKRVNVKGINQTVALTPFFGMGQFGFDDSDALSTWL